MPKVPTTFHSTRQFIACVVSLSFFCSFLRSPSFSEIWQRTCISFELHLSTESSYLFIFCCFRLHLWKLGDRERDFRKTLEFWAEAMFDVLIAPPFGNSVFTYVRADRQQKLVDNFFARKFILNALFSAYKPFFFQRVFLFCPEIRISNGVCFPRPFPRDNLFWQRVTIAKRETAAGRKVSLAHETRNLRQQFLQPTSLCFNNAVRAPSCYTE